MVWPTLLLWIYAVAYSVAAVWSPGGRLSPNASVVARFTLGLVIAGWVMADARKRRHPLCYDYDTLVFFLWPVVVPVYLIRTRGWRAGLTLLCFAGLWVVCAMAVGVVLIIKLLLGEN